MKSRKILVQFTFILAALFMVPSCAVNPVTGKKQLMFFSEAQEVKMGKEYDPQVIATFGLYEDEELSRFITEKGKEMGEISHRPNLEYHFRVLDSPVVNAFAVPGGYVYFTRGILAQFNNEAELAGVLGHEIGHITARHTVSQQSKQQLGQILLIGGMIASEEFRQFADYAMQGMQLLFLKYGRDAERESDQLGVEYSTKIGYNSHEMANFFNVLHKMQMESESGGVPTFLSTHPDPADRLERVHELTEEWQDSIPRDNYLVKENEYLRMIDGIVYGEDPRQGYVEGNTFYHPELRFKYPVPSDWKVQNMPMQVQMAPSDGSALIVFSIAQENALNSAAENTLKNLQLNVVDTKRTDVNGMPAIVTVSEQTSQNQQNQQQTIRVLSYFIDYGKIFVFHGVTTDEQFNNYYRTFESTMVNFDELSDPSKLNVEPMRISVKEVPRTTTVADVLEYYDVPQDKRRNMALLNNKELNEQVSQGELIKIISE
ncbi:MAG: M48 family metalloprotease [Prolixibacteraceae bacterium]